MNGRPWSDQDDAQLRAQFADVSTKVLARQLGRSYGATAARASMLGLRKSAAFLASAASGRLRPEDPRRMPGRRAWSKEDDAELRARYPDTPTAVLARELGRSLSCLYQRAYRHGLTKSEAYLASPAAGRTNGRQGMGTRFVKGQTPHNRGLRRPGWGPGRMRETQFRKGALSGVAAERFKPVGSTRIHEGYLYRKVAAIPGPWTRNWKTVHVLLWEEAHGPLPPGHALAFKNGDRMDIRLENLELLTRAQLMARNTVHNLPAPLPQMVQLLGALNRKINRRAREQREEIAS